MQNGGFIEVLNFQDSDIVSYSVILIKGVLNYPVADENNFLKENTINCCCDGVSINWPVLEGHFRCLVALKKGHNEVNFRHKGCCEKVLTIRYIPRESNLCVVPIYFIFKNHSGDYDCPSEQDRSSNSACAKIGFCSKLVQSLYAEKLFEHGFGHKTFQLEADILNDAPSCRVFCSKYTIEEARELCPEKLWELLGRELMSSEYSSSCYKFLGVTSSTYCEGNGVKGDVALGSGGLALIGSLSLCTWPQSIDEVVKSFSDPSPVHFPLSLNLWYKGSKGGCCSASIGSLCHELGHTFDLGHPSSGIMSTDFHLLHSVFLPVRATDRSADPTFDLEFERDLLSNLMTKCTKMTDLNRRSNNNNRAVKRNGLNNFPNFSSSCAAILSYHKWFNDNEVINSIQFEPSRRLLKSEVGLKVVQLRGDCGKVIKSWEFAGDRTQHMVLPNVNSPVTIFALDKYGNTARFSPSLK